jgi:transcriptional regulator with XRE-family HTH domain
MLRTGRGSPREIRKKEGAAMSIGKNISQLRKHHRLTQSELASKLGVTEQSVSKWENDVCAPDVSLFPQLAKLFNVSIDRLFGFHLDSYEKEVQKILDADRTVTTPYDEIAYYEQSLARYPNSDRLKLALAFAYSMLFRVGETEEEKKAGAEKAIDILHEIIGVSFDESILDQAYQGLSRIYTETGRFTQALETLEKLSPNGCCAKMILTTQILHESKKYDELRLHVEKTLFEFYMNMETMTSFYFIALYEQEDYEQALQYCNLKEKILQLFDEGGQSLYTVHKINNAQQNAHMMKRFDRKEDCFRTLSYLAEMARAALRLPDTASHRISALNSFFGTCDLIEPHMRAENVKEMVTFMLSQFREYFEGDERFDALLAEFAY